jgi:hypothetical protein
MKSQALTTIERRLVVVAALIFPAIPLPSPVFSNASNDREAYDGLAGVCICPVHPAPMLILNAFRCRPADLLTLSQRTSL